MGKSKLSYKEALEYLYGLQKYGIKFGLSKTSNLMKAFGNPHHGQRYIHIAGSNGKGSVAAILESILINAGLKVGFYSSPHLVRFTERFRINRKEIDSEKTALIAGELKDVINPEHPPTFFEVTTAMALLYFAAEKTDIAIMEVGMGGRLDATNIIKPIVSAITNISLEHQSFLGSRLLDIAGEKAGIIKGGVDVVTAATQPAVINLFRSICEERDAPFWRVGKDVRYRNNDLTFNYYGLNRTLRDLELGLKGNFQHRNAALALAIIELQEKRGFKISVQDLREGLKKSTWPGRMHIVSKNPFVILDGAHNPAAIRQLTKSIKTGFDYGRLILVLGIMEDKDIGRIIQGIVPMADYVIYTMPDYYRSAQPEQLMGQAAPLGRPGEVIPVIPDALTRAKEIARPEDMILVSGSLFTVGEAISCLKPEEWKPDEV